MLARCGLTLRLLSHKHENAKLRTQYVEKPSNLQLLGSEAHTLLIGRQRPGKGSGNADFTSGVTQVHTHPVTGFGFTENFRFSSSDGGEIPRRDSLQPSIDSISFSSLP